MVAESGAGVQRGPGDGGDWPLHFRGRMIGEGSRGPGRRDAKE